MTTLAAHTGLLTGRSLRAMRRQPVFLAITLVQPVIWLLLFGALFRSVVRIPGFAEHSTYVEFLTPGVVMMTALFSAGWSGTTYIEDMDRGVMDRLLTGPVRRGAMMAGPLVYQAITTLMQTLVLLGIAVAAGARFAGGAAGVLVTLVAAALLAMVFAAVSNAVALLARQQEALIGISQLVTLPLQFLSSAFMALSLAPGWLRAIARYNPVEWAVAASRTALGPNPDWALVWERLGLLACAAVLVGWAATRAFRAYQRSL